MKGTQNTGTLPLFRTILTIGAIQVVTMAFNLLRSKIVAVTVGPRGFGVISVVDQVVAVVAQVSALSLPFAAVKFLSATHSESREAFVRDYKAFERALVLTSLLGTSAGAALVLGWPAVLGDALVGYASAVLLALLAIPATNMTGLLTNAIAASRRAHASTLFGLITAIALAVISGGGILVGGLHGYYGGSLVAAVGLVGTGMLYLFRREGLGNDNWRGTPLRDLLRSPQVLGFAGATYVIGLTAPLAYLIARYAVLWTGGFEATGLLQAAMGVGFALATVLRSPNAVFLTPAMSRRGEEREKFQEAVGFLRALSVAIGLIALPMVLFPDWWLFLVYSRDFVAAAPYVYLFVLAEALQLLAGVNQALVIGLNHTVTHMGVCLAGHVGIAAVSLWLVPHYGIGGVAIAFLFNGALLFALTALRLWFGHGMAVHRAVGGLPLFVLTVIGVAGAVSSWCRVNTPRILIFKTALWLIFIIPVLRSVRARNDGTRQSLWRLIWP